MKRIIFSERDELTTESKGDSETIKKDNPVIDKTGEQETVPQPKAKKNNTALWVGVIIVVILLIISIIIYLNLKKKSNENTESRA